MATPNNVAKFYYRSYCDKDVTGYTFSGDYNSNANVADRSKLTYAITNGYDTDGDSVDFIVDMDYNRDVDTIVLKSNLKNFTIYYWDEDATGGGAYEILQAYTTNADEFIVLTINEIETDKIKITATHTITANEEKTIYLLEITKKITEMNLETVSEIKKWTKEEHEDLYGGSVQIIKYPNRGKMAIDLNWANMTETDVTAYNILKNQTLLDSYNCYIYFSDTYTLLNVEAYYLVNDIADYISVPSGEAMTEGIEGSMKLREC